MPTLVGRTGLRLLPWSEKEPVGTAVAAVVREVRVANASEVTQTPECGDWQSPMNEPVVHDSVRHAEERHADANTERDVAPDAGVSAASVQDERDGERRVEPGQRVVRLEAPGPHRVMRAMNAPQERVPHAPVQERRPRLHHGEGHARRRYPHDHAHVVLHELTVTA